MDERNLRRLLEDLRKGRITVDEVVGRIQYLPFEDLGFAKVDHHRALRCGVPEVIFCEGKTDHQIQEIARHIVEAGSDLLATRAGPQHFEAIQGVCPQAHYHETARCVVFQHEERPGEGLVLVVTAGTSDLPVAEEAAVTARTLGSRAEILSDVGVAGIHRLLTHAGRLREANVLVVVAGMEGALASVVAGLVSCPVIGVPTSIGYGASFKGIAPLLTMLNSCAAGVAVVNIDNGFGAGYIASLINRMAVSDAPATAPEEETSGGQGGA